MAKDKKTEIAELASQEYGIEAKAANQLTQGLDVPLKQRDLLIQEFDKVSALETSEENVPKFAELRKKIVTNRTQGIEKWHKSAKAYFLKGGQFVDAIRKKEIEVNQNMEAVLLAGEKHFENLENARLAQLQLERASELVFYIDEDPNTMALSDMPEDVWDAYLATKIKNHEDKLAAEAEALKAAEEEARLDKVAQNRQNELAPFARFASRDLDLRTASCEDFSTLLDGAREAHAANEVEQKKIREENARLRQEAEARDQELEKARVKAAADKKALEAAQAAETAKAKKEADDKAAAQEAERQEAERLAKAPVKEKLQEWVESFQIPAWSGDYVLDGTNEEARAANRIMTEFAEFKAAAVKLISKI